MYCLQIKWCMYKHHPLQNIHHILFIQQHVQYFTGWYSIKTAEVTYYDKTYSREIKMGC